MPDPEPSAAAPDGGPLLSVGKKLVGIYVLRRLDSAPGDETTIWQAYDEVLAKDISLHFIPAAVRTDSRVMAELRQEFKRNRQLIHSNILRVYDLIEEADLVAISMDPLFEAKSTATLLKQKECGFFEPNEIKPWLRQLCSALEDVHKMGLLHRDISLKNLFIDKSQKVLLANFGISRLIGDALGRFREQSAGVSPTGSLRPPPLRQLASVSPQQLNGDRPTRADDMYALGAALYELLTGTPPFFEGDIVAQIRKAPLQPMMDRRRKRGKNGGPIPAAWEMAIGACLAKTEAERPQSEADLAAKLGLGEKVAPVERPRTYSEASSAVDANVSKVEKSEGCSVPSSVLQGNGDDDIVLELGDFLHRVPPHLLRGVTHDLHAPLRFDLEEIADRIARGETTIPLNEIYRRMPLVFKSEVSIADNIEIRFPWQKIIKILNESASTTLSPGVGSAETLAQRLRSRRNATIPVSVEPEPGASRTATPLFPEGNVDISGADAQHKSKARIVAPALAVAMILAIGGFAWYFARRAQPLADLLADRFAGARSSNIGTPTVKVPTKPPASERAGAADHDKAAGAVAGPNLANPPLATQLSSGVPPRETERRAALVVGCGGYLAKGVPQLSTPVNDARRIAAALRAGPLSFDVVEETEATRKDFFDAVYKFKQRARGAKVALIYYSGHGIEFEGENYLIPVDAVLEEPSRLESETIPLGKLLYDLQLTEAEAKIVVLDACRDNPFGQTKSWRNSGKAIPQVLAALGPAQLPEATLVCFATAPGRRAAAVIDETSQNSPFTEFLLKRLITPGEKLRDVFEGTAKDVTDATDKHQIPYVQYNGAATVLRELTLIPPKEKPYRNTLGMEFAPVPIVGGPTDTARSGVKVLFARTVTTVAEYGKFIQACGREWPKPSFQQAADHPAVNVSWEDGNAFCAWLTDLDGQAGLLPAGGRYRLPSDHEWSCGAGIGENEDANASPISKDGKIRVYPWGTGWPPPAGAENYSEAISHGRYEHTSSVKAFPPNALDLYDMGGSVWQWCIDRYDSAGESSGLRVLRGAPWPNVDEIRLRSSSRNNLPLAGRYDGVGFRCVLVVGG